MTTAKKGEVRVSINYHRVVNKRIKIVLDELKVPRRKTRIRLFDTDSWEEVFVVAPDDTATIKALRTRWGVTEDMMVKVSDLPDPGRTPSASADLDDLAEKLNGGALWINRMRKTYFHPAHGGEFTPAWWAYNTLLNLTDDSKVLSLTNKQVKLLEPPMEQNVAIAAQAAFDATDIRSTVEAYDEYQYMLNAVRQSLPWDARHLTKDVAEYIGAVQTEKPSSDYINLYRDMSKVRTPKEDYEVIRASVKNHFPALFPLGSNEMFEYVTSIVEGR